MHERDKWSCSNEVAHAATAVMGHEGQRRDAAQGRHRRVPGFRNSRELVRSTVDGGVRLTVLPVST